MMEGPKIAEALRGQILIAGVCRGPVQSPHTDTNELNDSKKQ